MCQGFQALPRAGGVMDQDCYIMLGMNIVLNAQAEKAERERKEKSSKSRKH